MTILARLLHVVPSQGRINIPPCFTSDRIDALLVSGLDGGHAVPAVEELAERLQIPGVRRIIVPGPADVVTPDDDRNRRLHRLLEAVRQGREPLDDTLDDPGDRGMYRARFERFLQHVARLRHGVSKTHINWTGSFTFPSPVCDVAIRVLALNSVFVARGPAHDGGHLALGLGQLPITERHDDWITIPLSYYPLTSTWFQDAGRFLPYLCAMSNCSMPDADGFGLAADMDAERRGEPERAAIYVVERGPSAVPEFTLRRDV